MAPQLVVFEDEIVARELRRQRLFRERDQPFDIPEADFRDRYRLTRPKFDILFHMIEADLQHPTGKNQSLSPALQLAVGLRFYACGSFQQVVGDTVKVHKTTVCRSISRVTDAIVKRKSMFLSWPSEVELQENANLIFNRSKLPNVCGLIDGTHIQLKRPHANEESYVNRKGVHSINMQITSLSNYKKLRMCVRGGLDHHMTLGYCATLDCLTNFENGIYPGIPRGILLGNSWLITPLLERPAATVSIVKLSVP